MNDDNLFKAKVGSRVRKQRELAGLTKEDILKKLNVSRKTYDVIENGKTSTSVNTYIKLAEIFNVDPDIFFSDESSKDQIEELSKKINLLNDRDRGLVENLVEGMLLNS